MTLVARCFKMVALHCTVETAGHTRGVCLTSTINLTVLYHNFKTVTSRELVLKKVVKMYVFFDNKYVTIPYVEIQLFLC